MIVPWLQGSPKQKDLPRETQHPVSPKISNYVIFSINYFLKIVNQDKLYKLISVITIIPRPVSS
jgi:hypothetical protein